MNQFSGGTPTPAHRLGQTATAAWSDPSTAGPALFYLVTHPTCPNVINDGGFEAGPHGGAWTEASTNFGTPICHAANRGQAPRSGIYWVWFGGVLAPEDGSVSQSVVIAPAFATLSFWFSIPSCESFGLDTFNVDVDGTTVFSANNFDPTCGEAGYRQVVVDLSAFANGASHVVRFRSHTNDIFAPTNFMVDDVRLEVCP